MPNYPDLFSPIRLGNQRLRNRIIAAPMTYPVLTSDGCLTPEAIAFYELRAEGGAGAVTVSELIVDSELGKYYDVQVITDAPTSRDTLAAAARAVYRHGAVPSMELSHGGMYALVSGPDFDVPFGPSDVRQDGEFFAREMTPEIMKRTLAKYAAAARLVRDAGFGMILLHAGHGWLLQQFLSPSTNKRGDAYGGSLHNRARFALETLEAVRSEVGPDFPIEARVSAREYMPDGYPMDDFLEFCKLLDGKVELLQVSTGAHHGSFDRTHPSMFMPRGVNVRYAEAAKAVMRKTPVAAIGALNEPDMMNDIIREGRADIVEMARALLADPFLPKKAAAGRADLITRCYRCFTCMAERLTTGLRACALNPMIGAEYELKFAARPTRPRRVLVVGGGPAGLTAALEARNRGHDVTLAEASDRLGGQLNAERGVEFKADLVKFIATKERQLREAGVTVLLGRRATPAFIREIGPDEAIIAIGARDAIPPIGGVDLPHVLTASDLYARKNSIGQNVVIIGGGLVGCETAVHLRAKGHCVTLVEMTGEVAAGANPRYRPMLIAELEKSGATVMTDLRVEKITPESVFAQSPETSYDLLCDNVILAAGTRPLYDEALELGRAARSFSLAGDCAGAGNVHKSTLRGFFAARDV